MPYAYVYQCDRCGHDEEVLLCREFRRDESGARVDFEYPVPDVYVWPPRKVAGLYNRLWCGTCRRAQDHVLVEVSPPADHAAVAFLQAQCEGLTGCETGPCPECGDELLAELEDQPCPECDRGVLQLVGEYEL